MTTTTIKNVFFSTTTCICKIILKTLYIGKPILHSFYNIKNTTKNRKKMTILHVSMLLGKMQLWESSNPKIHMESEYTTCSSSKYKPLLMYVESHQGKILAQIKESHIFRTWCQEDLCHPLMDMTSHKYLFCSFYINLHFTISKYPR